MKLSSIKTSARIYTDGLWVTDIPDMPGLALKVRAMDNFDYQRVRQKALREIPRVDRLNGVDPEDDFKATNVGLVEAVLTDWSGLDGDDDKPLPFSKAKAEELISNLEYSTFREAVMYAALVVKERGKEQLGAQKGN